MPTTTISRRYHKNDGNFSKGDKVTEHLEFADIAAATAWAEEINAGHHERTSHITSVHIDAQNFTFFSMGEIYLAYFAEPVDEPAADLYPPINGVEDPRGILLHCLDFEFGAGVARLDEGALFAINHKNCTFDCENAILRMGDIVIDFTKDEIVRITEGEVLSSQEFLINGKSLKIAFDTNFPDAPSDVETLAEVKARLSDGRSFALQLVVDGVESIIYRPDQILVLRDEDEIPFQAILDDRYVVNEPSSGQALLNFRAHNSARFEGMDLQGRMVRIEEIPTTLPTGERMPIRVREEEPVTESRLSNRRQAEQFFESLLAS